VRQKPISALLTSLMLSLGALTGCHHAAAPVTENDVAKAQADAQKEIDQAHLEARKDIKNAVKQAGSDSKNVAAARVTGNFDVAMANADGDHKVAIEKCMLLAADAQQSCKDQADAQYQAATASAKAVRGSKLQGG
jgi:replication-associated recombination protein RarA